MKIGIDCRMYSSNFTGIGRYVYELTEHLFKLDQENEYVLFFNQAQFDTFTPPNKRVKKVLVNARHYSVKEQTKFLAVLLKEKLDLMHFTHFNAPLLYPGRSVVTIHDLTLNFYPGKKMTSTIHRVGYHLTLESAVKKAKKVIAVSNNTKKDLTTLLNTPDKKIEVIYEGVNEEFKHIKDENALKKVKEKYNLKKPFLLYTGVWRSHKNLTNLIKAFKILKDQYYLDCNLVITGRDDPHYPEVKQETTNLQLENDVIFTGLVPEEDLILLYNAATIYVFPSLYEGFGLPPLEAMQCHTPVVASGTSCIPEICGQGNALFFNPASSQNIADRIYEVYIDKPLREKMARNGALHVKKFSWEKMTKETLKLYKEALKK